MVGYKASRGYGCSIGVKTYSDPWLKEMMSHPSSYQYNVPRQIRMRKETISPRLEYRGIIIPDGF